MWSFAVTQSRTPRRTIAAAMGERSRPQQQWTRHSSNGRVFRGDGVDGDDYNMGRKEDRVWRTEGRGLVRVFDGGLCLRRVAGTRRDCSYRSRKLKFRRSNVFISNPGELSPACCMLGLGLFTSLRCSSPWLALAICARMKSMPQPERSGNRFSFNSDFEGTRCYLSIHVNEQRGTRRTSVLF